MVTLISGLIGGFFATIVMTVFMMALGDDDPPPTALFWSKYIGDSNPSEYMIHGLLLHLFYGTAAGGIFVGIIPVLGLVNSVTIDTAVIWGLIYGVIIFVGAAVFWMNIVLGLDANRKKMSEFLFFHLVYGAVLGAWIGTGVLS